MGFPSRKGWIKSPAIFTKNSLIISKHPIMEKWQTNYMKMLASIVSKNGGEILEVGFGMGIAFRFIEKYKIKRHTVIEFHPQISRVCKETYAREIKAGRVRLIRDFWERVVPKLRDSSFDGILFDTYPLTPDQLHKNHFWFFKHAYRLLKRDGVFTYYSDEATGFSKEHTKKLREAGFRRIEYKICKVRPPKNFSKWNKKTIIAPIIRK